MCRWWLCECDVLWILWILTLKFSGAERQHACALRQASQHASWHCSFSLHTVLMGRVYIMQNESVRLNDCSYYARTLKQQKTVLCLFPMCQPVWFIKTEVLFYILYRHRYSLNRIIVFLSIRILRIVHIICHMNERLMAWDILILWAETVMYIISDGGFRDHLSMIYEWFMKLEMFCIQMWWYTLKPIITESKAKHRSFFFPSFLSSVLSSLLPSFLFCFL